LEGGKLATNRARTRHPAEARMGWEKEGRHVPGIRETEDMKLKVELGFMAK